MASDRGVAHLFGVHDGLARATVATRRAADAGRPRIHPAASRGFLRRSASLRNSRIPGARRHHKSAQCADDRAGRGARLETKSPQVVIGREVASTNHLECDLPAERLLSCPEDDSHSARTDDFESS